MRARNHERLSHHAAVKSWYRRLIDSTRFWLWVTVYVVLMAALTIWLDSQGVFAEWMKPIMFVTFCVAFGISLATFVKLWKDDRSRRR